MSTSELAAGAARLASGFASADVVPETLGAAIGDMASRMHGVSPRTNPVTIATEVLNLNARVRDGAAARLDYRAQPSDYPAMLAALADDVHAVIAAADLPVTLPVAMTTAAAVTGLGAAPAPFEEKTRFPFGTIAEAAKALRHGQTTSVALTRRAIEMAEATAGRTNAFIEIRREAALAQAAACDREAAAGRWRGPLHGIPLAHKDCFHREGHAMSVGAQVVRPALDDEQTATVLQKFDKAGAVDIGALNMSEFVCGPTGQNPGFGDCMNAWDATRISGGSSSGSGAAVAAGVVYGALGSDTGGSTRLPAALNGLYGIKPTYGLVSRTGGFPRAFSLDSVGPLARSIEDCALLLSAVAGYDPSDPTSSSLPVPDYLAMMSDSAAQSECVGALKPVGDLDPDIQRAFDAFLSKVEKHYTLRRDVPFPMQQTCYAMGDVIAKVEAATLHGAWLGEQPERYSQAVFSRTEIGLHVPAVRYLEALLVRARLVREFVEGPMKGVDVLVCPTTPVITPRRVDADMEAPDKVFGVVAAITRLTRAFNYLGVPVLSIPIGLDSNNMPVGMQLIGRPYGEARLFAMAKKLAPDIDWAAVAAAAPNRPVSA